MQVLHDLKVLARTKSIDFVRARSRPENFKTGQKFIFRWKNQKIYYRPGTSDRGLIYEILVRNQRKSEYWVDAKVNPTVIFDIGANIGITAIWLADKFPGAKIFCFEPMPENFELLKANTSYIDNIRIFNFGLSDKSGFFDIYPNSDLGNLGGFSLHKLSDDQDNIGTQAVPFTKIEVRDLSKFLTENDIGKIDLIKVDTEGSEFEILSSIPTQIISTCQWIMGEVHGVHNFETMALLDKYFRLSFNKKETSELFTFFGINRTINSKTLRAA